MLELANCRSRWAPAILARALWVLLAWLPLPMSLSGAVLYGALQDSLPPTPDILVPPPGSATVVLGLDGTPIGGLERGLAPWIQHHRFPPLLVEAFLAAEDDDFFLHRGMDLRAILRAALANVESGRISQGGSTITQQVAKMFVGAARTYERKLVELLVARRIEARFTKWEILECYLNRVYLGAGAHGVVAASRIYFDRSLTGLTLEEAATLAGIASAPSSFEPYDHPELAVERRNFVLNRMENLGFVTSGDAGEARSRPLALRQRGEIPVEPLPQVTETIRRTLVDQYGPDAWRYGGLTVITPVSPVLQRYGERALMQSVADCDKRQGYRGPLRRGLTLEPESFSRLAEVHFPHLSPVQPGLVLSVDARTVEVRVDGRNVLLGPDAWAWASPFDEEADENEQSIETPLDVFAPGDLVLLERNRGWSTESPDWSHTTGSPESPERSHTPGSQGPMEGSQTRGTHTSPALYELTQYPRLEGALVAMDLDTGYLRAMVAGIDWDRSQFNRALQGCRQPGSVFKPVIYSLALERGYTLATPMVDVPVELPQGGVEIWRPRNADGRFMGHLLLREALIWSRNLPTISLFSAVGVSSVIERAQALGFTTELQPTDALSLGASCVYPVDVVTAFSVFAREGQRQRPLLMTAVLDGQGRLLVDQGAVNDAVASASAMLSRAMRQLAQPPLQVISPRIAYLVRFLLTEAVRLGTGHRANELGFPAAGKTGTTTAYDAWFAGFTHDLASVVWIGSDRNTRPLGRGETGASVSLPAWVAFMREALRGWEQGSLTEPVPEGITQLRVDLTTGLLAQPDGPGAWLPFARGSEPAVYSLTPDQRDLIRLDRIDDRF